MGPAVAIIEVISIITTVGVVGQIVSIKVIQNQIKALINSHQKQFDALKDIKAYLQSLISENDINNEQTLQKNQLFQNLSQIETFLKTTKQNLQKLIASYPQKLAGYLIPTQDEVIKILSTSQSENVMQNLKYLLNKKTNDKQIPSFIFSCLNITSMLKGVDWDEVKQTLLIPGLLATSVSLSFLSLKSFLTQGFQITTKVVLGSVLSVIGIAYNIYNIVDDAEKIKELIDNKDQINKQIALLPKTEADIMNALKGSIITCLMYLIVGSNLIQKARQRLQFIIAFSTNQQSKKQFKNILSNLRNPHQLVTIDTIKKISGYAAQLQGLFHDDMTQTNAKAKILQAEKIFDNLFQQVRINDLHRDMASQLSKVQKIITKANQQFYSMKNNAIFLKDAIKLFKMPRGDKQLADLLQIMYLTDTLKNSLDETDELVIVKTIASLRQKFFADDQIGLSYRGFLLSNYENKKIKYANIEKIKFNQEDITWYSKDWIVQYEPFIKKQLYQQYPAQKDIKYYRSALNFHGNGPLRDVKLLISRSIFFKGNFNLYQVQCGLQVDPSFRISVYTGQNINQIKITKQESPILKRGSRLSNNQFLTSENGLYRATLQQDGNFVTKLNSKDYIWSTQTSGKKAIYQLSMQYDGNLCLYVNAQAIWLSKTWASPSPINRLVLQNDGRLVIYDQFNSKKWQSFSASNPILKRGSRLSNNQFLTSENGLYRATLQQDGNFVTKLNSKDYIWSTQTSGKKAIYQLSMQYDGNLCLYVNAQAIWLSKTWASPSPINRLVLQNDGRLVIYDQFNSKKWQSFSASNPILKRGSRLSNNQFLTSENGLYRATLQQDGNFVTKLNSKDYIWSTQTSGKKAIYQLSMQYDGNLCLYVNAQAIWLSKTWASPSPINRLVLQNDGRLVIYDQFNSKKWQSFSASNPILKRGSRLSNNQFLTSENGLYRATLQQDGNFVTKLNSKDYIWSTQTSGKKAIYQLSMQYDGNLCLYVNAQAIWLSKTWASPSPINRLVLQNDGRLVIYDQFNSKKWQSFSVINLGQASQ